MDRGRRGSAAPRGGTPTRARPRHRSRTPAAPAGGRRRGRADRAGRRPRSVRGSPPRRRGAARGASAGSRPTGRGRYWGEDVSCRVRARVAWACVSRKHPSRSNCGSRSGSITTVTVDARASPQAPADRCARRNAPLSGSTRSAETQSKPRASGCRCRLAKDLVRRGLAGDPRETSSKSSSARRSGARRLLLRRLQHERSVRRDATRISISSSADASR